MRRYCPVDTFRVPRGLSETVSCRKWFCACRSATSFTNFLFLSTTITRHTFIQPNAPLRLREAGHFFSGSKFVKIRRRVQIRAPKNPLFLSNAAVSQSADRCLMVEFQLE